MPEHGRTVALQQLLRFEGDRFRWFRDQIANGTRSVEVLPLTFALGHALWYLGFSVDKQELPEAVYETFGRDVVGMLQGKSSGERLKEKIYRTLTGKSVLSY